MKNKFFSKISMANILLFIVFTFIFSSIYPFLKNLIYDNNAKSTYETCKNPPPGSLFCTETNSYDGKIQISSFKADVIDCCLISRKSLDLKIPLKKHLYCPSNKNQFVDCAKFDGRLNGNKANVGNQTLLSEQSVFDMRDKVK